MVKEVKYGVISDIHEDPRIIVPALQVLRQLGAEKLLVNGDIGGWRGDLQSSQDYTAFILGQIARTGMESFIQPGSHEPLVAYGPVVEHFAGKFSNIIDALKVPRVEQDGHTLVFLPGSDFTCGGEYQIGNGKIPTGRWAQVGKKLLPVENWKDYQFLAQNGAQGFFHYSNMNDLRQHITNPENTIVICHVPRKFSGLETCVDMAEFGEATEQFNLQGNRVEKGSVFPIQSAVQIAQAGYPVAIKKENRGNQALAESYDELGVIKSVTGHFHESSHRANDRRGNHVAEGVYANELFWNSGHLDRGYTGILAVRGEEVKYQNVDLREYLK